MVGMLQAIPTTPLYERLKREGRLVEEDPNCNFVPKQMTRDELRKGYWDLVKRLVHARGVSSSATSRSTNRPSI